MKLKRIIIDVREPQEYSQGHAMGAINIPLSNINNLSQYLPDVNFDDELILYCWSGGRAEMACHSISMLGFSNVVNGVNQEAVEENYC
jgi:phage shock protein E